MNIGKFEREVEYLDPGLPVEQQLAEPAPSLADQLVAEAEDFTAPVKV